MRRSRDTLLALFSLLVFAPGAAAQWQDGNLALRTNGNSFRTGEQLKVEVLALKEINEPFFMQVSYRFAEPVKVKDKDGNETTEMAERTRSRQAGPVIESLRAGQSLLLDDTFHFGEGSATGLYTVEVAVYRGYTRDRRDLAATLRSCVLFQDGEAQAYGGCPNYLRGLKRIDSEYQLVFDGFFLDRARYSATLMSGGKVIRFIETGVYKTGPRELSISSEMLGGLHRKTFDILLHDHTLNYSSTLARVVVPPAP